MNRNELQRLASEWTRVAKNDIRQKVLDFMNEVEATPKELAYVLTISEGELKQIIEGNGEITLSTFAKLLIATGNALEIKPINETPLGCYDNIPNEREFERHMPRPNVFTRPKPNRQEPMFAEDPLDDEFDEEDDEFDNEFEDFEPNPFANQHPFHHDRPCRASEPHPMHGCCGQPRDERGRFTSFPKRETSPFDNMTTDELANIIKKRLWDSEIDLNRATKKELVNFLNEKDKKMKEFKRIHELENDPKVLEFKDRLKKTMSTNPHLREWAKKLLGDLEN